MRLFSFLVLTIFLSQSAFACALNAKELNSMLSLNFKDFDQTQNKGHRKLAEKGCFLEAAEISDIYHLQHKDELEKWQNRISYFHSGQYYAMASTELYPVAVKRIGAAYDPEEKNDSEITWNIYVDATIAFLNHDLRMLKQKRIAMEIRDTPMQKINIRVVDGLIRCFDKPYLEAYKSERCRGQ